MFPIYLFDRLIRIQNVYDLIALTLLAGLNLFFLGTGVWFLCKSRRFKVLGLLPLILPVVTWGCLFSFFIASPDVTDLWAWRLQRLREQPVQGLLLLILCGITLLVPFWLLKFLHSNRNACR